MSIQKGFRRIDLRPSIIHSHAFVLDVPDRRQVDAGVSMDAPARFQFQADALRIESVIEQGRAQRVGHSMGKHLQFRGLVVDHGNVRVAVQRARESAANINAARRPAAHQFADFAGEGNGGANPCIPQQGPLAVAAHVNMDADRIDMGAVLNSGCHIE